MRNRLLLFVAAVAAIFLSSCREHDFYAGMASDAVLRKAAYEWNQTQAEVQTFGERGVTLSVEVAGDWCSLSPYCSGSTLNNLPANSRVTIYMKPNRSDSDREAAVTVRFSDGTVVVLTLTQRCENSSGADDNAEDDYVWVSRSWGELPEYAEGADLIHKSYYTTLADNSRVRNYSVCFDRSKKVSRWVAYPLHEVYMPAGSDYPAKTTGGRTDAWAFDDAVTEYSATKNPDLGYGYYNILSVYDASADAYDTATPPVIRHSWQQNVPAGAYNDRDENTALGLARGHMLPSASRVSTFAANAQTFYATNMMPQVQSFNQASWAKVEDAARESVCADTLYVVVGTLYESGSYTIDARDRENIGVPSHCYKLLLRTRSGATGKSIGDIESADELICIGFLFNNSDGDKNRTPSSAAVSVSEIESRTGFKFFCNLNPAIADRVKSQKNIGDWPAFR